MDMLLFANRTPILGVDSLQSGLASVRARIERGQQAQFHLESYAAPAPSRTWVYDAVEDDWVEQMGGFFEQKT